MITIAIVAFWVTVGFVIVQSSLVFVFVRQLRRAALEGEKSDSRQTRTEATDCVLPKAGVVLCVRGVDPSLEDCLQALIEQDYPAHKIYVVGDSTQDPGVELARQFSSRFPDRVEVLVNDEILETCGLKCSNLIFALQRLESECEFFVLVDADTVPPPNWLGWMLEPFSDPQVSVTTGIRWFEVEGSKLGTWVRYIWNTAAIVQMVCYRIPWGGSLAIRNSFLREGEVLEAWSRGFCEDTMLHSLVRRLGGRVEVVPAAVIRSREETTLDRCLPWISRQLLTARLHHPKWPLVFGHGLLTAVLSFLPLVLLVISLILGSWEIACWSGAAYLLLQVSNFVLLHWIESPVRLQGKDSFSISRSPFFFLVSILVTQVCYVTAVVHAVLARRVEWRQVTYRIRGRKVEMENYQPYQQSSKTESL